MMTTLRRFLRDQRDQRLLQSVAGTRLARRLKKQGCLAEVELTMRQRRILCAFVRAKHAKRLHDPDDFSGLCRCVYTPCRSIDDYLARREATEKAAYERACDVTYFNGIL